MNKSTINLKALTLGLLLTALATSGCTWDDVTQQFNSMTTATEITQPDVTQPDVCPVFPQPNKDVGDALLKDNAKESPVWPWFDQLTKLKSKLDECHKAYIN